jgi:hypothetical protein
MFGTSDLADFRCRMTIHNLVFGFNAHQGESHHWERADAMGLRRKSLDQAQKPKQPGQRVSGAVWNRTQFFRR